MQQSEQYDLLLLEACACDTLPLLGQEVIIVNKLLFQQWERHMLRTIGIILLYDVLIVAPSRMLQQLSLELHLKQKLAKKRL